MSFGNDGEFPLGTWSDARVVNLLRLSGGERLTMSAAMAPARPGGLTAQQILA